MKNHNIKLPDYPCEEDLWDKLSHEVRPIVCYGMGNGADKLIERFKKYNIEIADFFASDGFVRGHSFHGKRVLSFSEIKEKYPDFVIVLSFASNREEVLSMLCEIESRYEMYIPDMPVAGEEYFDREFFNANYSEIKRAYDALCDEQSRKTFASIIRYKLSGSLEYLENAYSKKDDLYGVLPLENISCIIDAGAYNGDTVREAKHYFPNLKSVVAIEPDLRNFKKLTRYSEAESDISIKTINAAVWSEKGFCSFFGSGNRNSTLSATASFEHRDAEVETVSVDSIECGQVDFIKYDIEGAELEGLRGSHKTIMAYKPAMLVSAYHRSCDIFSLVNYLGDNYGFYKIYLRRLRCVPAWELDILLVNE